MARIVLISTWLVVLGAVAGCTGPGNSPREAYEELRRTILEEDDAALLERMSPTIRRLLVERVANERGRLELDGSARDRAAFARRLGAASFGELLEWSGGALAAAELHARLGNALRRDWVARSAIDESWNDRSVGAKGGIQQAGPDRAKVRVRTETAGEHDYRFALSGGRWWWRPELPTYDG
jgi:hypothetical protein